MHIHTSLRVLPRDVYFHVFTSMRCVFPRMYFHDTCTLHDTSKHGPRKHITGMYCSIAVVPRKITRGKMKLQLSSTVTKDNNESSPSPIVDDNDTESSTSDKGASSDDNTSSSPLTNHRATCGRGATHSCGATRG